MKAVFYIYIYMHTMYERNYTLFKDGVVEYVAGHERLKLMN